MKSKGMEKLLRALLVLLGAGLGLALAQLILELFRMSNPTLQIPPHYPVLGYIGMAIVGGLILLLLSRRILRRFNTLSSEMQRQFDKMPINQVLSAVLGLILGLIVAALLRQMLSFVRSGVFITALTAILYVTLGALGYNIGKRKSRELMTMVTRVSGAREKSKIRKHGYAARKFLDTSSIIDGRILEVARAGFVEGEIVIPQYVIDELQHLADSPDDTRRERGRRGLALLKDMQEKLRQITIDDTDFEDLQDVDVKLLRQARDCGGTVITLDSNLQKAAAVSGVKSLNVNELAEALRPAVTQGMTLSVRISKEGKEAGQGVAYLDDGTMIVVSDGKKMLGETVSVLVTSVLQTSAGRMVFARLGNDRDGPFRSQ